MTPLYAGIGGVVRELTEVDAGIGGVVTPLTEMWAGIDGVKRQIFSAGKAISEYSVGDELLIQVDEIQLPWILVHKGLPSSLYSQTCNGGWLVLKDCYTSLVYSSNTSDYFSESDVFSYLNGAFFNMLNDKTQSALYRQGAKIPYVLDRTVYTGDNGLSANVFLLSPAEVGFSFSYEYTYDVGSKLSYFLSGYATEKAKQKRIALLNGSASTYYTRTPRSNQSTFAVQVSNSGIPISNRKNVSAGIRPAIILPLDFIV